MAQLKDRALLVAVGALALLATLVDFTSAILSVFADGLMMLGMMGAVMLLYQHMNARIAEQEEAIKQLRNENQALRINNTANQHQ